MIAGHALAMNGPDVLASIRRFEDAYRNFYAAEPAADSPHRFDWERRRVKLDKIAMTLRDVGLGARDAINAAKGILGDQQTRAILRGMGAGTNRLGNPFIVGGTIIAVIAYYGYKTANEFFNYQLTIAKKVEENKLPPDWGPGPGPFANFAQIIKWSAIGMGAVVLLPTIMATLGILQESRQSRSSLRDSWR